MKEKLLQMRAELERLSAMGEESAAVVELDQSKVGRLSRMDAMQAQAMAQASARRREAMLARISAALKRIENGDYGVCHGCDEDIDPRRLEIDPTVLYCIRCASSVEGQ